MVKALAILLLSAGPASAECGVALALIIDVSGSVSQGEFELQMTGTAQALLEPSVRDALLQEQAALTLIQWSGASKQEILVPWTVMESQADLAGFSSQLLQATRVWQHYSTAIGSALAFAGDYFSEAPVCDRRVIDVSGDGEANEGSDVDAESDKLVAQGFVINAIAIEGAEGGLTRYYKRHVIGGPGSFVLTASDYADYPRAIQRKLINEVVKPAS